MVDKTITEINEELDSEKDFFTDMLSLKSNESAYVPKKGKNKMYDKGDGGSDHYTTESIMNWINVYPPKHNIFVKFRTIDRNNHCGCDEEGSISKESRMYLVMDVCHKHGYEDHLEIPFKSHRGQEATSQQDGSFLTYAKRQLAAAYFGLNDEEDDDANEATLGQIKNRIIETISKKYGEDNAKWPVPAQQRYWTSVHAEKDISKLLKTEANLNLAILNDNESRN